MFRLSRFQAAFFLIAVIFPSVSLRAQFSSNVQGAVLDSSGAPIPGAKVQLRNTQTGVTNEQSSNGSGIYRFSGIAPGSYQVTGNAPGFGQTQLSANVTQGQTQAVDLTLKVSSESTEVTVNASAPSLDPDETRLQASLSAATIRDLPLQNRNIYSIATLAPGVTGFINGSSFDNFGTGQQLNVSANGHYFTGNTYIVDGQYVIDNILNGAPDLSPNPDTVQDATLQTNTWGVEHGIASSVVTELTTKSGSNSFHGNSNFIFSNQDLRARTVFINRYAPQKRYDVDGTLGGPIVKNRTFFFIGMDIKRSNLQSTGLVTYENPVFVDFANRTYPNTLGTRFFNTYTPQNASFLRVLQYANPNFTTTCTSPTPTCNTPYLNQGTNANAPPNNGYQYNLRGDQYFNDGKDRLFGSYYRTHNDNQANQLRPALGGSSFIEAYLGSVNYQHSFSSALVNQASFGIFHIRGGDLNNATPFLPYLNSNDGASINGTAGPSIFSQYNWQGRDTVSYLRGRHSIKAGVEVIRPNDIGNFNFSAHPNYTYQRLIDFAADNPFQQTGVSLNPLTGQFKPQNFGAQSTMVGGFIQDEWKVKSNLLLTFGIRWDNFGNPYPYGTPDLTSWHAGSDLVFEHHRGGRRYLWPVPKCRSPSNGSSLQQTPREQLVATWRVCLVTDAR